MKSIFLLIIFFASLPLMATKQPNSEAVQACVLLLGTLANESRPSEGRLLRGKEVFLAASRLLENGTGIDLSNSRRAPLITQDLIDPLIEGFKAEYLGTSGVLRQGRTAAPIPIAEGNVAHMKDHLDYFERFHVDFKKYFGVDAGSLKLAVVAHDIGKAFVDEFLDAYVAARTNGDFLKQYVMAHELHSIANIPKVVKSVLDKQGVDTNSKEGKELLHNISLQIIEMIRYHNGVNVVKEMQVRYPDLKPDEIERVLKAWWPENYRHFAADFQDVGLSPEYGTKPLGPISAILNLADRATLASPSAPRKLGKQKYRQAGFTLALIKMIKSDARGNVLSVLAQSSQLKPYLLDSNTDVYSLPAVKEAQAWNSKLIGLTERILQMNRAETLIPLGVSFEDLPSSRPNAGSKQYLYYRTNNGIWWRVEGSNAVNASTQKWNGKTWDTSRTVGHPVDHLMDLVAQDGVWP